MEKSHHSLIWTLNDALSVMDPMSLCSGKACLWETQKLLKCTNLYCKTELHWGWLQPLLRLRRLWLDLTVDKLQKASVFVLLSAGKKPPTGFEWRWEELPCTLISSRDPGFQLLPNTPRAASSISFHRYKAHLITSGPQTGDLFSENSYAREKLSGAGFPKFLLNGWKTTEIPKR